MTGTFYTDDDFVPRRSIGYLLKRSGKLISDQVEAEFKSGDLGFTQWIALIHLRHGMADNCAGLARALGHDSGATTRLVDQLEERGLLARSRSGSDRRVVKLTLTEAGAAVLARMTPQVVSLWNNLLEDFSHAEVETLISLLSRLTAVLEVHEGNPS
jgi:DNA-binding MarR family transcriptional regulator